MGQFDSSIAGIILNNLIPTAAKADAMFNARPLETYPDLYRVFASDFGPQEREFHPHDQADTWSPEVFR
jgi:hypothetical protein